MKYIKSYEQKLESFTDEFKRFILIKNEWNSYLIYEMDIDEDGCHGCRYLFSGEPKILDEIDNNDLLKGSFYRIDKMLRPNNDLIYQSDDLDDIIKHFKLLTASNKYNL
jgi:hypothetical protein